MSDKKLMRITRADFGYGGYQAACFGLSLTFETKGSGIGTFIDGGWSIDIERSDTAKWTEADRDAARANLVREVNRIMKEAGVREVHELVGIPVEVTFTDGGGVGSSLKEWRVLTEVLP